MDTNSNPRTVEPSPATGKLAKEQAFLQNLHKIAKLDSLITAITDHFNQGLTDLAYLRFKNEALGYSLTGGSYSETPAKRVVRESNNLYSLETNSESKWMMEEPEEPVEDPEETTGFLSKLKGESESEMLPIDINEQILTKFGITNRDPLVYHSQSEFLKAVEAIIELRNFLSVSGVYS